MHHVHHRILFLLHTLRYARHMHSWRPSTHGNAADLQSRHFDVLCNRSRGLHVRWIILPTIYRACQHRRDHKSYSYCTQRLDIIPDYMGGLGRVLACTIHIACIPDDQVKTDRGRADACSAAINDDTITLRSRCHSVLHLAGRLWCLHLHQPGLQQQNSSKMTLLLTGDEPGQTSGS